MRGLAETIFPVLWRLLPKKLRQHWGAKLQLWQLRAMLAVPASDVTTYSSKEFSTDLQLSRYSLLSTVLNEASGVTSFLDSVLRQSHLPTELIIVDGGSSDGTVPLIRGWQEKHIELPFKIHLQVEPGANIARGRNLAAKSAKENILAFTDAGCELDRQWAHHLLFPFADNPEIEMSMGYYRPVPRTRFSRAVADYLVPKLPAIDPPTFLPSARSLALKKSLFEKVGGFPEWLTRAGEDSLFAFYAKLFAVRLAFVPDALVFWKIPTQPLQLFRTISAYAQGDAENGKTFWAYYLELLGRQTKIKLEICCGIFFWLLYAKTASSVCVWLAFIFIISGLLRFVGLILRYRPGADVFRILAVILLTKAQGLGFFLGLLKRPKVEQRRILSAKSGHFVLLAPYLPIGQELFSSTAPADTTLSKLLSEGYYVTLLYPVTAKDSKDPRPRIQHPLLETHQRSDFVLDEWLIKHRPLLKKDGRKFICLDLVEDSWSRELLASFQRLGA